jgi:hypothetical protein
MQTFLGKAFMRTEVGAVNLVARRGGQAQESWMDEGQQYSAANDIYGFANVTRRSIRSLT